MLTIFIDTCVWWNWFTYCAGAQIDERIAEHCKNFDEIYRLVQSRPDKARFLYNKKIENELGERFKSEFTQKILPVSNKIPIPLTRLDGAYCCDGSIIFGGRMGGSLRGLLTFDGYDQEIEVAKAASNLKSGEKLYDQKSRRREFDIEHMESALEANAHLFLTNDERTILELLQRAAEKHEVTHPICVMHTIAKTPTAALNLVRSELTVL